MAKTKMQWVNALSTRLSLESALDELVDNIKGQLTADPHIGIIFISSAFTSEYSRLVPLLLEKLPLPYLIGCGGGGIIGMGENHNALEIEGNPAISLTVAHLPEVNLHPFHILPNRIPDLDSSPQAWIDLMGVSPADYPHFILLSDPFGSKVTDFLEGLDFAYPMTAKIGGLASTNVMGIPSGLFIYDQSKSYPMFVQQGTVGLALSGNIQVDTLVAQGCRPIGQTYQVVGGERNVIFELSNDQGTYPALDLLRDLIHTLDEKDRELAQSSLFVGIVRDEFKLELGQRDFLIRNLLGVDPRTGAIAIGDRVRAGQRIQFHLRDARTSAEDLELLIKSYRGEHQGMNQPFGALMFSCMGRGERLYGVPHFDSELLQRYFPGLPLSGFFCNGEIGPVANQTFLHGYTSVFAFVREQNVFFTSS